MVTLAGDTIAGNEPIHVPSNLQNNARVAIASASRETWITARLAPIYKIVYLRTYTDSRVFVLDEDTVNRNGRKFILPKFHFPEISVD